MANRFFIITMGMIAIVISTAASADAPHYDFADLLYQTVNDPSESGFSSDHVIGVDGSYAFTDRVIGMASYGHENADFSVSGVNGTVSGDSYAVGVDYRFPLSDSVDLLPNLSYLSAKASATATGFSNSVTNTGYDVGVQLRAMVTSRVELGGSIDHSSPGAATNSVGVSALYNFTPAFAVGIGYASATSNGQNSTGWTVGLRYYFK